MVYSDELYHHGVKGQRWGIRKKIYYKNNGEFSRLGLAKKRKLTKKINKKFRRATRHDNRIVKRYGNKSSEDAQRKVALARNHINYRRKLLDIQRKEVGQGLNYLERKRTLAVGVSALAGSAAGSIIGNHVPNANYVTRIGGGFTGTTIGALVGRKISDARNKDAVANRNEILRQYKEKKKKIYGR